MLFPGKRPELLFLLLGAPSLDLITAQMGVRKRSSKEEISMAGVTVQGCDCACSVAPAVHGRDDRPRNPCVQYRPRTCACSRAP